VNPSVEDRLLARGARFGEWWTLERLHEAFDGLSAPEDGGNTRHTHGDQQPEPDAPSPAA
jgi:hypothetical protein